MPKDKEVTPERLEALIRRTKAIHAERGIMLVKLTDAKMRRLFEESYDLPRAPTSAVMISEAKRKAGIKALKGDEERLLVKTLDVMREYPTTTEWVLSIKLPYNISFEFKRKREFAKVSKKEEIKKKQE